VDKSALRQAIVAQLDREFALLSDAANTARAEATDEESRSEGKYDMRGQTAAYLAAGQAKMATETGEAIAAYSTLPLHAFAAGDAIALGALVTLEARGRRARYFLGPLRGGMEVKLGDETVIVVTPGSPLGRQLLGRRTGEKVTMPARPKPLEHTIAAVD